MFRLKLNGEYSRTNTERTPLLTGALVKLPSESAGLERRFHGPTAEKLVLAALFFVLIFTRSAAVILYVRVAYKMKHYGWFLSSVVLSLSFLIVTAPVALYRLSRGLVGPEMKKIPKYKLFCMGFLDAFGNLLATVPMPFLKGFVNVMVPQAVIPMTLLFSALFLKVRYQWTHCLGVVIMLFALLIQILPSIIGGITEGAWYWALVMVASTIPQAGSVVLKEHTLRGLPVDIWYFNAWVTCFQFISGIVLLPTIYLPMMGGRRVRPISPTDTFFYLRNATECFAGVNVRRLDQCGGAAGPSWVVFQLFIVFNFAFNLASFRLFNQGNDTAAIVASAIRVALTDLGFTVRGIAGEAYGVMQQTDVIALLVLMAGLVLYRTHPDVANAPASSHPQHGSTSAPPPAEIEIGGGGSREMPRPPYLPKDAVFFASLSELGGSEHEPFSLDKADKRDGAPSGEHERRESRDIRRDYIRKLGLSSPSPNSPVLASPASLAAMSAAAGALHVHSHGHPAASRDINPVYLHRPTRLSNIGPARAALPYPPHGFQD